MSQNMPRQSRIRSNARYADWNANELGLRPHTAIHPAEIGIMYRAGCLARRVEDFNRAVNGIPDAFTLRYGEPAPVPQKTKAWHKIRDRKDYLEGYKVFNRIMSRERRGLHDQLRTHVKKWRADLKEIREVKTSMRTAVTCSELGLGTPHPELPPELWNIIEANLCGSENSRKWHASKRVTQSSGPQPFGWVVWARELRQTKL